MFTIPSYYYYGCYDVNEFDNDRRKADLSSEGKGTNGTFNLQNDTN